MKLKTPISKLNRKESYLGLKRNPIKKKRNGKIGKKTRRQ
jgi:hypothetical protein